MEYFKFRRCLFVSQMALTRPKGQNFGLIFEKHDVSNRKFKVKRELDEISETIKSGSALGYTVLAMLPIQKLCSKYHLLLFN